MSKVLNLVDLKKEINKFNFKELHSTLDSDTLFLYYKEYQSIGGTDNLEKYTKILSSFLEITLDPVVFGNLEKPDGTLWNSSQDSIIYWEQKHKLTQGQGNLYFCSVDQVNSYT